MLLRSNYRDSDKEQFEMEIIDEDNEFYFCKFLPQYRDQFQDGYGVHKMPKRLVGDQDSLYSLVDGKSVQLSLFDF